MDKAKEAMIEETADWIKWHKEQALVGAYLRSEAAKEHPDKAKGRWRTQVLEHVGAMGHYFVKIEDLCDGEKEHPTCAKHDSDYYMALGDVESAIDQACEGKLSLGSKPLGSKEVQKAIQKEIKEREEKRKMGGGLFTRGKKGELIKVGTSKVTKNKIDDTVKDIKSRHKI